MRASNKLTAAMLDVLRGIGSGVREGYFPLPTTNALLRRMLVRRVTVFAWSGPMVPLGARVDIELTDEGRAIVAQSEAA